jgi:O-antigen/teichoic acid export membrane protein
MNALDRQSPAHASSHRAAAEARSDKLLAIRNAAKLIGSLVVVWIIGLTMRLLVPRYLGPELFGQLNFADAFAAMLFVALTLGVDVYIRKEISTRPGHASDIFGGLVAARLLLTLVIFGLLDLVMQLTHRPAAVRQLVYIYGAGQVFASFNAALSALLQAKGSVDGMSLVSIATKVIWAAGLAMGIAFKTGLWLFAFSYVASEGIETFVLFALARRHLGLRFRVDVPATRVVLIFGLPYFMKTIAQTAYQKVDVSLLGFLASDREVGWYAAAATLASIALLLSPLISWVLTPLFARAVARSKEDLYALVRRVLEMILAIAIPAGLAVGIGADLWIGVLFGSAFEPATTALRILSVVFVVTYVGMVSSITLMLLNRGWALTAIALGGMSVNFILNLLLIRTSIAFFGPGGGGIACATAMLGTEIVVTTAMLILVGGRAFDGRTLMVTAKLAIAAGAVVLLDRALTALGPARLLLDAAAYLFLVALMRAVAFREIAGLVRSAFHPSAGTAG